MMGVWVGCRPDEWTWRPGAKNIQGKNFIPNDQKPKESENKYQLSPIRSQKLRIQSSSLWDSCARFGGRWRGWVREKAKGLSVCDSFHWLVATWYSGWATLIFRDSGRTLATLNLFSHAELAFQPLCRLHTHFCSELIKINSDGVRTKPSSPSASILYLEGVLSLSRSRPVESMKVVAMWQMALQISQLQ